MAMTSLILELDHLLKEECNKGEGNEGAVRSQTAVFLQTGNQSYIIMPVTSHFSSITPKNGMGILNEDPYVN